MKPRLQGCRKPSVTRRVRASRTGVRLTPRRAASSISLRRSPGLSWQLMAISRKVCSTPLPRSRRIGKSGLSWAPIVPLAGIQFKYLKSWFKTRAPTPPADRATRLLDTDGWPMSSSFNGADGMVRMLQLNGVKHIFGLCGDTSLPFYDAWPGWTTAWTTSSRATSAAPATWPTPMRG
jgi:hypothetical protein